MLRFIKSKTLQLIDYERGKFKDLSVGDLQIVIDRELDNEIPHYSISMAPLRGINFKTFETALAQEQLLMAIGSEMTTLVSAHHNISVYCESKD